VRTQPGEPYGFLAAQGVEDAESRTGTLLTCVDGLVFDPLTSGGTVSGEDIGRLVTAAPQ
jgi:hypothetical protein